MITFSEVIHYSAVFSGLSQRQKSKSNAKQFAPVVLWEVIGGGSQPPKLPFSIVSADYLMVFGWGELSPPDSTIDQSRLPTRVCAAPVAWKSKEKGQRSHLRRCEREWVEMYS
jgi:hypothetical protein